MLGAMREASYEDLEEIKKVVTSWVFENIWVYF